MWHICLYVSDPDFSCGQTDGLTEVFHEALADLKIRMQNVTDLPGLKYSYGYCRHPAFLFKDKKVFYLP